MLDWDSLINASDSAQPSENQTETTASGTKCPTLSHENGLVSHPEWDSFKPVTARLSADFLPSGPTVPRKKQGRGNEGGEEERRAGGAAVEPQDLRADKCEDQQRIHPAHPAAVLLVMAWSRLKQIANEERAALLFDLESMAPSEQVRYWNKVCMRDGLKPWHVLCLPAQLSGSDCTKCRRLVTRHEAIGSERVQFHWACDMGYLILEHGRGTERIWIAPPECKSFERWYPSDWR